MEHELLKVLFFHQERHWGKRPLLTQPVEFHGNVEQVHFERHFVSLHHDGFLASNSKGFLASNSIGFGIFR